MDPLIANSGTAAIAYRFQVLPQRFGDRNGQVIESRTRSASDDVAAVRSSGRWAEVALSDPDGVPNDIATSTVIPQTREAESRSA